MSPLLLIQLIKSMCILSRRGTRQSCGCVTKLLNWRFCTIKPNKHFQKKCWNSLIPPFLAFSPHPPSQTPPLVLEILRVRSPITQCLFMSSTLTKARGKGEWNASVLVCFTTNVFATSCRFGFVSRREINKVHFHQVYVKRVNVPGSLCLCTCCATERKQGNPFSTKDRLISGLCGAFGCWVFEAKEGWDLT